MAHSIAIQKFARTKSTVACSRDVPGCYLLAPPTWKKPATSSESTIHQLAPYIGKLKSTIARDLIQQYSGPGDLIIDPFSGSGTIPLEAAMAGRRVLASDISSYAAVLTQAKLNAPHSVEDALSEAEGLLSLAEGGPAVDLRHVPAWVRQYFNPKTLKAAVAFARACRGANNHFMMACLLGILHHQRPGFLSYPSSHLVPYLRNRKYPPNLYPEMYGYRPLRPRLLAKIRRAFRRAAPLTASSIFVRIPVEDLMVPKNFGALITSPPYMNALDYGRDNRLRLWFLEERTDFATDDRYNSCAAGFRRQVAAVAKLCEEGLAMDGRCVLIVGESVSRGQTVHPAEHVAAIIRTCAPSLMLETTIVDSIPDVRRARRDYRGVKTERIIVFRKVGRL